MGFVDSATPRQSHFNPAGDLPVGATAAGVNRAYYNFDLSGLPQFTDVTFEVPENGYRDCGSRALELWRTDAFTARSTWRNRPAERARVATGGPGDFCDVGNPASFDVTAAVRAALDSGRRSITFGLRVDAAHEADQAFYRLFGSAAVLRTVNNTPPDVPTELRTAGEPCVAEGDGPFAGSSFSLTARATDPDVGDQVVAHFAWWPLADPAQRRTAAALATPDASVYPDLWGAPDGAYAWEVHANDGRVDSAPSGTCRFTVDNTDPNAPVVTSATYPTGQAGGGPGVTGEFTFSPNGSTDVVRYSYNFDNSVSGEVAAGPDGTATVAYTPSNSGPGGVYVYAYDRAGNFSISHYGFTVRETRPTVTSVQYPPQGGPDGGVGVSGVFLFSSPLPGVVAYRYRFDDGAAQQVAAAADGRASVTFTPQTGGEHVLYVRSVDTAGAESPDREYRFLVDTAPVVTGPANVGLGVPAEFSFRPRMPGVVSYDYWFDHDPSAKWTVGAAADGTATVGITLTDIAQRDLRVRARDSAGALSSVAALGLSVNGWRPEIDMSAASFHQGVAGTIGFTTPMPGAVEFEYWLATDPATRWRAPVTAGAATVSFTPDRVGDHLMYLRARNSDGVWSTADEAYWWVTNAPDVSSVQFSGVGSARALPGEFTFTSHQPNAVAFEYSFDWSGEYQRVDVGPDGTAVLPWTPVPDDELVYYTLKVRTVTADGTVSLQTEHGFSVTSAPYVSSVEYPEDQWAGGPGVPGTFTFTQGMPGMTSYTYYVKPEFGSPGESRTVPADAGGKAGIVWTPPAADRYILVVYGTTADGARSASIGYTINVNRAP